MINMLLLGKYNPNASPAIFYQSIPILAVSKQFDVVYNVVVVVVIKLPFTLFLFGFVLTHIAPLIFHTDAN